MPGRAAAPARPPATRTIMPGRYDIPAAQQQHGDTQKTRATAQRAWPSRAGMVGSSGQPGCHRALRDHRTQVGHRDGVVIDVRHPGARRDRLRGLVGIRCGRKAAAKVDELPHPLVRHPGDGPREELPVLRHEIGGRGKDGDKPVTHFPVRGGMILAAKQVIVDPRAAWRFRLESGHTGILRAPAADAKISAVQAGATELAAVALQPESTSQHAPQKDLRISQTAQFAVNFSGPEGFTTSQRAKSFTTGKSFRKTRGGGRMRAAGGCAGCGRGAGCARGHR